MTEKKAAKKAAPKKPKQAVAKKKPPIHPAPTEASPEQYGKAMDEIIQYGDLASLTVPQRSEFLYKLALSMGLNPISQPFELIVLNGKLTIYAKRTAADQLRQKHNITSEIIEEGPLTVGDKPREDVYRVKVRLEGEKAGVKRSEFAVGCVGIDQLSDEALANAIMKCHTKAIRRGTLSFCGMGFLDELEVDSVVAQQANPNVGQPRRLMPRITPSPQPAGTSSAPVVVPPPPSTDPVGGDQNPPSMVENGDKKVTPVPSVFPPITPPVKVTPVVIPPKGK